MGRGGIGTERGGIKVECARVESLVPQVGICLEGGVNGYRGEMVHVEGVT